jgi:predicted aspartyl protease
MVEAKERPVGRFSVEVDLANDEDVMRAERGEIPEDQVRRARVRGVVDSGAARLVIPATVAEQLGVKTTRTAKVRYADGHTADRPVVNRVHLSFAGRDSVFNAIVEPGRDSALIGAIVLEDLDLLIDCTNTRLIPRDPKQIISEIE